MKGKSALGATGYTPDIDLPDIELPDGRITDKDVPANCQLVRRQGQRVFPVKAGSPGWASVFYRYGGHKFIYEFRRKKEKWEWRYMGCDDGHSHPPQWRGK